MMIQDTRPLLNRTVRLGPYSLDLPVVQAALSGYSDWPMRMMARHCGAPYAICEVMLDEFILALRDRRRTRHHLETRGEYPVGAQLMGAEPERFGPAARRLVAAGFHVIDINFGCPVKKVLGRCRGGFHLGQPRVAIEIIRRVRDAVPEHIPVTLKMRRGLDDSPESRAQFFQILDAAFDHGLAAVTVHGRTVAQRYRGPSDWGFLKEVKQYAGTRTILGSGDVFDASSCVRMLQETGVDAVSAARGAIGNPWLFQHVRSLLSGAAAITPPDVHEQRAVICEHLALTESVYPAEQAARQMRKLAIKYARLHPELQTVRNAFAAAKDAEMLRGVLKRFYHLNRPGRWPQTNDCATPDSETRRVQK